MRHYFKRVGELISHNKTFKFLTEIIVWGKQVANIGNLWFTRMLLLCGTQNHGDFHALAEAANSHEIKT